MREGWGWDQGEGGGLEVVLEGDDRIATARGFPLYVVSGERGLVVGVHYFAIPVYFRLFCCKNVRRESCGGEQLHSTLQKISDDGTPR